MPVLQQSSIREIATEIAKGNTCYVNKLTTDITIIDFSLEDEKKIAAQEKLILELERKMDDYVKVEKLTTENELVIMKDFLVEIADKSVRKQLSNALNRKNPIRNFNQTVESDMALQIHWRNFNFEEYQRWISNFIIDAYNF